VIAGVLNMLVIYDAFAGPMFRDPPKTESAAGDGANGSPVSPAQPSVVSPAAPAEAVASLNANRVEGTP
jgi:hypothetical protein